MATLAGQSLGTTIGPGDIVNHQIPAVPVAFADRSCFISVYEFCTTAGVQVVGNGVADDSAAINAAFLALSGSGKTLVFPSGVFLCTAAAIVTKGVAVQVGPLATFTGTYAGTIPNASGPSGNSAAYKARLIMTAVTTSTTYTGTGTNTITFGTNAIMGSQDGVAIAVGDVLLLQGGTLTSCVITACDTGPWVVSVIGTASTKCVLTRPAWWLTGDQVPSSQEIKIGPEGTLFRNGTWFSSAAPGCVIGTTDPALYPDRVIQNVTLVSSTATVINVPILSATKSSVLAHFVVAGGTTTATIGYGTVAAPTAGYVGTASTVVDALASGMGKNGTADTSIIEVIISNR